MPTVLTGTNVGPTTIPANRIAEYVSDTEFRLATPGGRPWGVASTAIMAGATGNLWPNGTRTCDLAPGETVAINQRLILAADGMVRGAPNGYTGWTVGKAQESKTAGASPVSLLVKVAPFELT